jgi:SpoVK/Ycf46/Vps4 family AAA+-type ATPase
MSNFIINGERIVTKPEGQDYDLMPGKVYDLLFDNYEMYSYLKENGNLNMPKKIYEIEEDIKFMDRVLLFHNSEYNNGNTGVLLAGDKGTGKSMLAKRIALKSNLPIIIVDSSYPLWQITKFFKKVKTETCIIFDEIEKNPRTWPSEDLLTFLDGIQETGKKIVIMTCNKTEGLDENLFDRCSRIRYYRKYKANANEIFIKEMIEDKGLTPNQPLIDFIKRFTVKSFDNINSFLDEYKLYLETTDTNFMLENVANIMNISLEDELEKNDSKDNIENDLILNDIDV